MNYLDHLQSNQQEKDRADQTENNAGGFVFALDPWKRLDRFLILGCEGNTYYQSERQLTRENASVIEQLIQLDGIRVVNRVAEISNLGRAPKNAPAIFVLALAAKLSTDENVRRHAFKMLPAVCRTGTDLFAFCEAIDKLGGWGQLTKRGVANWYTGKAVDVLAYQLVKYQQRNGWSHKDVLRLCHAPIDHAVAKWLFSQSDASQRLVARWNKQGEKIVSYENPCGPLPKILEGFERAKRATTEKEVASLVGEYGLTREMIPTQWLTSPAVWEALLEKMPITATIRNLATMTSCGLLRPFSEASKLIAARITTQEILKRGRVHPISLLSALKIYARGYGERSKKHAWTPCQQVVAALDAGFYLAFENIEPTNKNIYLAVDISGSMNAGVIAGVPGLTPRVAAAAMAMATLRKEPNAAVFGFSNTMRPLEIGPQWDLGSVCRYMQSIPMGSTDCSAPMLHALRDRLSVDSFVIYTDNETWSGEVHPYRALKMYRERTDGARLVVVGMTATGFTIADPKDAGMLDLVGFDSAAPNIIADFVRGNI